MNRRKFLYSAFKTVSFASSISLVADSVHALAQPAKSAQLRATKAPPPQLAITMDDPKLKLDTGLQWPDANSRILKALDSRNIRAALFVCGMRVDEPEGSKLLSAWDRAGHIICNHSYSHLNYCGPTSYADFAVDFLKNEKIIAPYPNKKLFFRYPFLKEGDTADKRDRFRALLKESGYRVGHVTIDTSDWYVNERMADRLAKRPKASIQPYCDYLIAHLLDRAAFYCRLAIDVVGRDIRHTLLIHYNSLNALVLPDVMAAFETAGWQWIDASLAYQDEVFHSLPKTLPAGESLIWALASETSRYKGRLRYPGEDGTYEDAKLNALDL
ncbi:MAG TPA: polysaccharide deacetylase family protein [Candidatus Solibacter sp.]|nr:polysaccharide deacetylase family protein [Candidatus Solibacter sp.]